MWHCPRVGLFKSVQTDLMGNPFFWREIKNLSHLPSDGRYSSKVNWKYFNTDMTLHLRQKQQLFTGTGAESPFERTNLDRKDLPNFLKVLRESICPKASNSQAPVKREKSFIVIVLSFILAFCYSQSNANVSGNKNELYHCYQKIPGKLLCSCRPELWRKQAELDLYCLYIQIQTGNHSEAVGGTEHWDLIHGEIREILSLPEII